MQDSRLPGATRTRVTRPCSWVLVLVALVFASACASPARAPAGSKAKPSGTAASAANTGVARCPALSRARGRTITVDGTVLENLDVRGEIAIDASNVTLRCVRIRARGLRAVISDGRRALLDRVEVDCQSAADNDAGVVGSDYTLRRVNIHHCEDGAKVGENVLIERSYIHHMNTVSPGAHYDGLQLMGCACFTDQTLSNVTIRRNTIETRPPTATGTSSGATSAILIKSDMGRIDGVTIASNRLNCGAYTVYSRDGGHGAPSHVSFINNTFGRCYEFGLSSFDGAVTRRGNVRADGRPVL